MKTRFESGSQGSQLERRIGGGSGFADSIFRKQADSEAYAREMFVRTLRKLNLDHQGYEFYTSESSFLIKEGKKILLQMTFEEVEDCRALAIHALEEEMEGKLAESSPNESFQ